MKNLRNIILTGISAILLFACNTSPIEVEKFTEYSKINQNEKAKIYWKFKNAHGVLIEGYDGVFAAEDSLEVSTDKNKSLNFSAYRTNLDTVRRTCLIEIQKPEVKEEKSIFPKEHSDFMVSLADENRTIEHIKFAGYNFNPETNLLELKLLTFDEFGSYSIDYELNEKLTDKVNIFCGENIIDLTPKIDVIKSFKKKNQSALVDLSGNEIKKSYNFLFDNSMLVDDTFKPELILSDFSKFMENEDKLSYSEYNLNYNSIGRDLKKGAIKSAIQSYVPTPREGLNSLYKSIFKQLEEIKTEDNSEKILVVFTYNSDNASIIYNAEDITGLAKTKNIPIYFIAIGGGLNTYSLRYISAVTGGKFYHLDSDELHLINPVLAEISNLQNNYIKITYNLKDVSCQKIIAYVELDQNQRKFEDKMQVFLKKQSQFQPYQAIAAFDQKSSDYNRIYEDNIITTANLLKENPQTQLLLVGNTGEEGDSEYNENLGLKRSQTIKDALINNGADANQIKVKSNSNKKMLFQIENSIWQGYLNRRVELKWLDPSVLPFELCSSKYYESEELAISAMEKWESKGFKAYYDRINFNNSPVYRIKFWGYATEDEAKAEIRRINKDYKENFSLE